MTNPILEDIAAEIGFRNTVRLAAAYGRKNIYVPATMTAAHPLAKLLGIEVAQRLAKGFGNEILWIGDLSEFERWRMVRAAGTMAARGISADDIAAALLVSKPTVKKLLAEAETVGLARIAAARIDAEAGPQADPDLGETRAA